ncbi:glycosyltransferase family 2 protein [Clostridium transplantifaecale]|uniref:glycosyltransferase family 2 protein n=1 Tax=Clostridium transplantifaecale TaxID=2479838 RepID=UPI000F643DC6|nr:glycosyltransferase family A protein [Clostridium transplantifaecale]
MNENVNEMVSVIITSYRGSAHLMRAAESVIYQTYKNIELIVVDDNDPETEERKKTEACIERLKGKFPSFPLLYIQHPQNMNGAVARNTGVQAAQGMYVQLLDDDDVFFPEKIAVSVEAIKTDKTDGVLTGVVACSNTNIVDISGALLLEGKKDKRAEMVLDDLIGTGSNLFLKKQVYLELGGFDTSFRRMQDLEFMMRFFRKNTCSMIERILIIKMENERGILHTDYHKQLDYRCRFWDKYQSDFQQAFTAEDYRNYFEAEYAHLFKIALMNPRKEDVLDAKKRLETIRPLSKKESSFVKYHSIYYRLHKCKWIVVLVRKFKPQQNNDRVKRVELSAPEWMLIKQYLKG